MSYGKVCSTMSRPVCQFNTLRAVETNSPSVIRFFNTRATCCVIFFSPSFLFYFSFPFSKLAFFFFSLSSHKALHAVRVVRNGTLPVFFLNFLFVCLAITEPLVGEKCFIVKPIFRSGIYGDTCARIIIQGTWSNLCHINIKYLIVFSLCSCSTLVESASLYGLLHEVLAPVMMLFFYASGHERRMCLTFSFSYLELWYKLTFHNLFRLFLCML